MVFTLFVFVCSSSEQKVAQVELGKSSPRLE